MLHVRPSSHRSRSDTVYVANTGTDFFTTGYANLTSTVTVINGATCNGHITTGCYPRLLPVRTGGWPAYIGLDPGSRHHICVPDNADAAFLIRLPS